MILKLPEALPKLSKLNGWFNVVKHENTRSSQQNKALHLMFEQIAEKMNDIGLYYNLVTPFTGEIIELRNTKEIIKEHLWKPIQMTKFNKKSTTKLTTNEINEIVDELAAYFAGHGVQVIFPNQFDLNLKKIQNELRNQ